MDFKFLFLILLIYMLLFIIGILVPAVRAITTRRKIRQLADSVLEVTPEEFFKIRNASLGGRGKKHISTSQDFEGVYILFNHTKDKYYVGQGIRVFQRVNSHFTGHGNGDVYADYKYGDTFTIKMIALSSSGFKTLNELERHTIATYGAYKRGYNRTRGNKG